MLQQSWNTHTHARFKTSETKMSNASIILTWFAIEKFLLNVSRFQNVPINELKHLWILITSTFWTETHFVWNFAHKIFGWSLTYTKRARAQKTCRFLVLKKKEEKKSIQANWRNACCLSKIMHYVIANHLKMDEMVYIASFTNVSPLALFFFVCDPNHFMDSECLLLNLSLTPCNNFFSS